MRSLSPAAAVVAAAASCSTPVCPMAFVPIYASGRVLPGLAPALIPGSLHSACGAQDCVPRHVPADNLAGVEHSLDGHGRRPVVVWVDGCFDMMHYGHANALRQARAMGDFLVVGVHSDLEIEQHKGPPVMHEAERYAAVAACKWVDVVVPRAPYYTSLAVLDAFHADFCVHGDDITTMADGTDCYFDVKRASRYRECRRTVGVSTTELVGRLLLMTCREPTIIPSPNIDATNCNLKDIPPKNPAVDVGVGVGVSSAAVHAGPASTNAYKASLHAKTTPSCLRIAQFVGSDDKASSGVLTPDPQRIVYVAGDFDLFHIGHVECLRAARALGDFLLVGLYDDSTSKKIHGCNMPLMTLTERALGVLSCRYVDDVLIGAPFTPSYEMLANYHVSVVALFPGLGVPGVRDIETLANADVLPSVTDAYSQARKMGILINIDWPTTKLAEFTTSSILWRIIDHRKMYEERNRRKIKKDAMN